MADAGYFASVSANLKAGVGVQVKGIADGVKATRRQTIANRHRGLHNASLGLRQNELVIFPR